MAVPPFLLMTRSARRAVKFLTFTYCSSGGYWDGSLWGRRKYIMLLLITPSSINCIFHLWILVEGLMPCARSKSFEAILVTDFKCFVDMLIISSNGSFCNSGGKERHWVIGRMLFCSSFSTFIMAKIKSSVWWSENIYILGLRTGNESPLYKYLCSKSLWGE